MIASSPTQLIDRFGRQINYLRISITDRCDFRCVYCMAEKMQFLPRSQILTLEEIYQCAKTFVELGIQKIRITGGEPLIRKGAIELLSKIGQLSGLDELVLTTNGSQLKNTAIALKQAGVKRINISLDSLDPIKFKQLTRTGDLSEVLTGIEIAKQQHFEQLKINAVILKNRNHNEVINLVQFAIEQALDISFIEEMPLGFIQDHLRHEAYYSSDLIKADLAKKFDLIPSTIKTAGPSNYYQISGTHTRVGFISPHSHNFCGSCNRVRLTAEGRLLLCLGHEHSVDLKSILRANFNNTDELKQLIIKALVLKPEKHEFNLQEQPIILRHMNATGG